MCTSRRRPSSPEEPILILVETTLLPRGKPDYFCEMNKTAVPSTCNNDPFIKHANLGLPKTLYHMDRAISSLFLSDRGLQLMPLASNRGTGCKVLARHPALNSKAAPKRVLNMTAVYVYTSMFNLPADKTPDGALFKGCMPPGRTYSISTTKPSFRLGSRQTAPYGPDNEKKALIGAFP